MKSKYPFIKKSEINITLLLKIKDFVPNGNKDL
jgi:hypothetical protein